MTRQTDKIKRIGEGKGITISMMAKTLNLKESTLIDKMERNKFTPSQISKLAELLNLGYSQIHYLFIEPPSQNTPTLYGVPYPIHRYPYTTESTITLDDGSTWRQSITMTLEEVRNA